MIQWHQYVCHCELALGKQVFGQPFQTKFNCYLLAILTDLTFQMYGSWLLLQKYYTLRIKLYIYNLVDTDIYIYISVSTRYVNLYIFICDHNLRKTV